MLTIGVGYAVDHPPSGMFPVLELEDDGYYWFLHPLFERLAAETGQYIDLYGNATFFGEDLDSLERTLTAAQELVLSQPEAWEVLTNGRAGTVQRVQLLQLLDTWEDAIRAAKEQGRPIICFGD
jgi:hypothetical protein